MEFVIRKISCTFGPGRTAPDGDVYVTKQSACLVLRAMLPQLVRCYAVSEEYSALK